MQLYSESKNCFGCGACAAICPAGAIAMRPDAEGFLYPAINEALCVNCGACEQTCPAKAELPRREGHYCALRCKDMDLLKKSTSGGAFSLLAGEVLASGGLVCGAGFDENFHVRHVLSEDIAPMRKSKYVQSDMTECFVPIREALEAGKTVLFSGTPCQCHGLERFLGGRPENLLLVAILCRGVASPGLWEDYAAWLGGGKLEAYDFRDKRRRNDAHTVAYTVDGAETAVTMDQDKLSRLYNRCLTYRPSCYACPYCDPEIDFDFSIGDFWGIENFEPKLYDGMGTSLVIARSEKARALLNAVEDKATILLCTKENAQQTALREPAKATLLRKLLFRDFAQKGPDGHCNIELILKKYAAG